MSGATAGGAEHDPEPQDRVSEKVATVFWKDHAQSRNQTMTKKPEKPSSASIRVLKTRIKKKSGLKESSRRWLQRHINDP
ncbi:MAG: hypothetical protein ABJB10_22070, partial [Mesorhizobium sp.]